MLDEFHERSLEADATLGLIRRLQENSRPELALVAMSATLDSEHLAAYLQCPIVTAHGRLHPVDIRYRPESAQKKIWDRAGDALYELIAEGVDGDIEIDIGESAAAPPPPPPPAAAPTTTPSAVCRLTSDYLPLAKVKRKAL